MKKRGRPPVADGEAKTARIIFAATQAEKDRYSEMATQAELPLAEWIRAALNSTSSAATEKPRKKQ